MPLEYYSFPLENRKENTNQLDCIRKCYEEKYCIQAIHFNGIAPEQSFTGGYSYTQINANTCFLQTKLNLTAGYKKHRNSTVFNIKSISY